MATVALGQVGTAIGAAIPGAGPLGAVIGGAIGSAVGSVIDSWIISSLQPDQRYEGPRLDGAQLTSSTEGAVIPRCFGRMRLGGNLIWATDFLETITEETQGGKGGGPTATTTSYSYSCSFAVAICEGPIHGIGRIWADGEAMPMQGVTYRVYLGDETQEPDPFIVSKMGADMTPAYRGTAYVVFENLQLERYGNRIPQITFEVFRPLASDGTAEALTRSVSLVPGTGEFAYATTAVRNGRQGKLGAFNLTVDSETPDFLVTLNRLQAALPNLESVTLVAAWFGNDLRVGECAIRPGVENHNRETSGGTWSVNGVSRADAWEISRRDGVVVYGGTPSDFSIVEAIQECTSRGLKVTFYPQILLDIEADNTLPDPYSNNAAGTGQAAYPWRGRITCSPAVGYTGAVDKTATAATQIASFFGSAVPGDYTVDGTSVSWSGTAGEWSLSRMILHYAHLCAAAGGVEAFLIGSQLPGITTARSDATTYPAVAHLQTLASQVKTILGATTDVSYAADWTEYYGHRPQDGSGDVFFHLDPLWADANVDFVGVDNFMPLADWRDGYDHLDAATADTTLDRAYLQQNIEGGEGYDWEYVNGTARTFQIRTPIEDPTGSKDWVYRFKDIRSWWENDHYDRPGGVESGTPTDWTAEGKPVWFTSFGCPAIDRGANQPSVILDEKSDDASLPYFSRGWRDDAMQRAAIEALLGYWNDADHNPSSSVYAGRMLRNARAACWGWDVRPYPMFPELGETTFGGSLKMWADGPEWEVGHWISGRLGGCALGAVVADLCEAAGLDASRIDVSDLRGAVEGMSLENIEAPRASLSALARHFGFDAIESQGMIRFRMRGRAPVKSVTVADLVEASSADGEPFEFTRGQETELPQVLKWTVMRSDEDYDTAVVEARRITVTSTQTSAENFAFSVPPQEVTRRARRALQEVWVGRETATFRLPPSMIAIDPSDVVTFQHDGRGYDLWLKTIADGESRAIEAMRQDRAVYDLPPGEKRSTSLQAATTFGPAEVVFMDLPQLSEDVPAYRPVIAAYGTPWPGQFAVYSSPAEDGFSLVNTFTTRAQLATSLTDFDQGPAWRWDYANSIDIEVLSGTLQSVTDLQVLGGQNLFAIEAAPGEWELFQAQNVELIAANQYRLSKLLRGQRGTERTMQQNSPVAAGARVVCLDQGAAPVSITEADIGLTLNWRVGPSSLPLTDAAYDAVTFTPEGIGLRPFRVAAIEQPNRRGRVPGDYTIRWKRRSRSLSADNWGTGEVPLAEESEAYEIAIYDGSSSLLRTLTSTTTSVTYTSAQQIADFGAELGPGDQLRVRIWQISATYGRGEPLMEVLKF